MDTVRIDTAPPTARDTSGQGDAGWAAAAHLIALVFTVIGAIIVNVAVDKRNRFVHQHTRQAINFQCNLAAASFAGFLLTSIAPAFVLLWPPLALAAIVLPIVAAVRANRGNWNPYPPLIPFLRALPEATHA
jgi:uncharacterized Tic20 family protein